MASEVHDGDASSCRSVAGKPRPLRSSPPRRPSVEGAMASHSSAFVMQLDSVTKSN